MVVYSDLVGYNFSSYTQIPGNSRRQVIDFPSTNPWCATLRIGPERHLTSYLINGIVEIIDPATGRMLQIDNLYIIVAEYSKEINAMLQHAITKMVIRAEIIDLPQKKKTVCTYFSAHITHIKPCIKKSSLDRQKEILKRGSLSFPSQLGGDRVQK